RTPSLPSNLNADQRSLQRDRGSAPIHVGVACRRSQALLGTFLRFFGSRHIDFFGALRCFGKNSHAVAQNFSEAADNRKRRRVTRAPDAIDKLSDSKFCDQRRVARKNAKFTSGTRERHLYHLLT